MLIQEKLSHQANMTEIEKVIADYFLEKPDNLRQNSTRKLGEILFVAPSTITRFCKRLGFTGYNDFKEDYLKEYQYLQSHFKDVNPNRPFEMSDGIWTMANKISQLYTETILDTLSLQNFQILEKAVHLLKNSNKIYVYSTGNHINLANNFKNKMLTVGKSWIYVNILDTFFESLFSKRIHSRECHHFRLISNGKTYLTLSGNDDKEASWISSSKKCVGKL